MAPANHVGSSMGHPPEYPRDLRGGRLIGGRYWLGPSIGRGGEGQTFSALDRVGGTPVAIKLFRESTAAAVSRVTVDFERLSGLEHPALVRVLDLGRHEGQLFLVTALVDGQSIGAIAAIADESRRRTLFATAARELTDALAYLHGRGVIHGDVSPANVLMTGDGHFVMIDPGTASSGMSSGGAVGTLGFAAPEALIGRPIPASDLFSLGATLFHAWTGTAPFGVGAMSVSKLLSGPAPALSSVRGGLSSRWDGLMSGLLRTASEERFSSARTVLRELRLLDLEGAESGSSVGEVGLLPPYPAGDALAGIFVGRAAERALLTRTFASLLEGVSPHGAIALVGSEGAGRRTLVDLVLRDLAISQTAESAAPLAVFRGTLPALALWLGIDDASQSETSKHPDDDPVRDRQRRFALLAASMDKRAVQAPLLVALSSGPNEEAFAAFVSGAAPSGRSLVLLPAAAPLETVAALDLPLAPLALAEVQALVDRAAGEPVPAAAVAAVIAATNGHAASVAVLVRQLIDAVRCGNGATFTPRPALVLEDLLEQSFRDLPAAARRLVATVGLNLPSKPSAHVRSDGHAEDVALAAGWLVGSDGLDRLPSSAHHAAFRRLFVHPDIQEVARQALVAEDGLSAAARGLCLEVRGRVQEAASAFLAAYNEHAGQSGQSEQSEIRRHWLSEAARLAPSLLNAQQRTTLATALVLEGRSDEALALLDAGLSAPLTGFPTSDGAVLGLIERKAWLLGRAGSLEHACELLQDGLAVAPPDTPSAAIDVARARLARLLVSLGRFHEAVAVAPVRDPVGGAPPALALEAAILAHAYGGDLPAARSLLARWSSYAAMDHCGGVVTARLSYMAALLDHLGGDLLAAIDSYRHALSQAEASGDVHTVAAIALNLGALAAESGRYEEALLTQDRAIRELGRLGAASELATALFNAGMTLLELGDLAGARALVSRLRVESGRQPLDHPTAPSVPGAVRYLEAELALRQGDERLALDLFTQVSTAEGLDAAMATGMGRAAILARVELLASAHRSAEADTLIEALAAAPESSRSNPRAAAELRLSRARVILCGSAVVVDAALELAREVQEDAHAAEREGRRPRAWRSALAAARLFHRAGQPAQASDQVDAANRLLQEIRMSTPIDHRAGLDQDPDARFLHDLARMSADGDRAGSSRAEDRLRRLLRINKRLNGELRLPRLLELIMDTIIELTEAERGFILLEDDKGELTVKVARNIDQETLQAGAFELSRSIARQAVSGGAPIVTIDAAGDPRFSAALSVSDLHLRSVLAVPLRAKGRAVGTLYVDNRLRKGAFGDDDVQLVLDFAEQAGIAIENARLLGELRRRERQIEVLNRRLQSELAVRKEELVGMKQELRENREALAIRYDYRNIIGRTPRMLELFRLLDRLTDTALPVVIQGESGTGKELVARALHFNGPRRDRPFVSENCAAIPETLLESTLFGAVRGAYTGADHDSRGLFEVADGGTLFLDEVGEMSPAMQGKLLRVLQTGELRRVGSERTRKVDVRVIAATNRDLGRMVEDGQFRQDLFFRLCVAPIALAPLRDRRDDIPAIVEHVLGKLGVASKLATPKRVTPAALTRLACYRWPGNVRELENELMRASALSDGPIDVRDLSPRVAGDTEAALTTLDDPDNLALRPRVERLERALLREALGRSGGNQTRAALALGLSRFGLQKKMHRYQIA